MTTATKIPITYFAPAERVSIQVVHRQAAAFQEFPLATKILNSVLNCVFLLNAQRQIVFASDNALDLIPGKNLNEVLGLRPGEALGCVHASDCENGCGTSEFCSQCGAAQAILASLAGNRELRECHMTRVIGCEETTSDLLVLATPLVMDNETFSLVAVADLNRQTRHQAMTMALPHGVINLTGGSTGAFHRSSSPPAG